VVCGLPRLLPALLASGPGLRARSIPRAKPPHARLDDRRHTHRHLDAVPEAYHNPAAVWWGAFAASAVIRDQVVMPTRSPVSSVNSASDRIPAWKVYGIRAPHGDGLPSSSRDLNMFVTRSSDGRGGLQ
jgi:hypothetical protein